LTGPDLARSDRRAQARESLCGVDGIEDHAFAAPGVGHGGACSVGERLVARADLVVVETE
jgi:hypothetical protein